MTPITVPADLEWLRACSGLERIVVNTTNFKYRNLMGHVVKYALWALRPGGVLEIRDDAKEHQNLGPHLVGAGLMRHWVLKFAARDGEVEFGKAGIMVTRTRAPTAPGWSAGVIFSGAPEEVPQLHRCLNALASQPELDAAAGGEIVVSGPAAAAEAVANRSGVRYRAYEIQGPRALIAAKKNDLIRQLRGPRIAVMHTRVLLEHGCLGRVPAEFEISTPRVRVANGDGVAEYLSFAVHDSGIPGFAATRPNLTLRHWPAKDYLALLTCGQPYVDGGVFLVRRDVHDVCPLHDLLAWGEAEDVEWCARALAQGFLVDLAPAALAISATNKLGGQRWLGGAVEHRLRLARALLASGQLRLQHELARACGRR